MTNAEKFKQVFELCATELWAMPEKDFLVWLNADAPDTNVGDMISRQAAIDAIETWGLIDGLSEGQAIEILADEEKVPSARQAHSEGLYVDGYNNGYRDGIKDAQPEGELDQSSSRMGQDGLSDLISRKAALDALEELKTQYFDRKVMIGKTQDVINNLPSAQPEIIRCRDCKHFEYDHPYIIQGVPVLGHEVCNAWGDGCKTDENGYCFMAERRTDDLG